MKTTHLGIVLAALLLAVAGLSHAKTGGGGAGGRQLEDCREANRNALAPVEAQYASSSAKLPKADQDRYKRMLSAIKTGGSTLSDCRGKTPKIAELKQVLAGMVAFAALPVYKIGDRAMGGIVFHVTDGGKHGLVADVEDVDTKWRQIHFGAAVDAATRSRKGGFSDWFIPDSGQLALLWEQRAVVGNFQTHRDHYWSSSRMQGDRYQQAKVYWRTFNNGGTGWSDTSDDGPNRPLFNARAIRKF